MSDLGPAIVTGAVALAVAVAGFISTGMQAARTQHAQDRATLRQEKRAAYANCMAALHVASDAAIFYRAAKETGRLLSTDDIALNYDKANTNTVVAISALALVAPDKVADLAWAVFDGLSASDDTTYDRTIVVLNEAMRADLEVPD